MRRSFLIIAWIVLAASFAWAAGSSIGVFIPGVRQGSPIYDMLAAGAEKLAAERPGTTVRIYEAGFNQAEWEDKLTSFVATGNFDIVLTSNPSMPELVANVSRSFPRQKFIILDGYLAGNPNVYSALYNQLEQGYIAGYLAGLASISGMKGTNSEKKVGMIIGQNYPVMDRMIIPGFEQGLKAADPAFQLDVRVLGNWYDAAKAADLAKSLFAAGVDVILPICGSASQGVIKAAQDAGRWLVFFDNDEFARAPGAILGCVVLHQDMLSYRTLKAAFEGTLKFGKADIVGMKEGYIELLQQHPDYIKYVPKAIRDKVDEAVRAIKSGALAFKVPTL